MKRSLSDPVRRTVLIGFVTSGIGILVQIVGGWDYPPIPPGLLITLAGGGVAALPFRWAPVISLLAGAFIVVGFVAVGDFANMTGTENALVTAGKWLQMLAVVAGTVAAVVSLVRPPSRRSTTIGT